MNILILEDSQERQVQFKKNLVGHSVVFCEEVSQAKKSLISGKWDILFLDHDLGGKVNQSSAEGTGWEIAKFISENPNFKPTHIILHSLNYDGRRNMKNLLPDAVDLPFAWIMSNIEKLGL